MADKVLKFDTDKAGQDITALGESVNQIDAMVETMTQTLEEMCGLWNSSNGGCDATDGGAAGEGDSAV